MKTRGGLLGICLALLLALATGCSGAAESQAESSVTVPESSAAAQSASSGEADSAQAETASVYQQIDSGAELGYEPRLKLDSDGSFELRLNLYDGIVVVSGTYEIKDQEYRMTVKENTAAEGSPAASMTDFKFTASAEDRLVYSGEQFGITPDGAEFERIE